MLTPPLPARLFLCIRLVTQNLHIFKLFWSLISPTNGWFYNSLVFNTSNWNDEKLLAQNCIKQSMGGCPTKTMIICCLVI